jgi:hypothetical protein
MMALFHCLWESAEFPQQKVLFQALLLAITLLFAVDQISIWAKQRNYTFWDRLVLPHAVPEAWQIPS